MHTTVFKLLAEVPRKQTLSILIIDEERSCIALEVSLEN
jgi:hypothetical protein